MKVSLLQGISMTSGIITGCLGALLLMGFVSVRSYDPNRSRDAIYITLAHIAPIEKLTGPAKRSLVQHVFGDCGYPVCRITYNRGGIDSIFLLAAAAIVSEPDGRLVIDGHCASACVMAADLAREHTCITARAAFFLHKARTYAQYVILDRYIVRIFQGFSDPDQSDSIDAWVQAHGGYPYFGLLEMPYKEALEFWEPCGK